MNSPITMVEQEVLEAAATGHHSAPALPGQSDSFAMIQAITAAANNPLVDIEKMERLWAMHERIVARDAEQAFNAAMTAAQSQMGRISADAKNSQTNSKYATYGQLDRHVRPIYTMHGFALSFDSGDGAPEGHERVLAYVSHSGGHTRTYRADIPNDGKGARGGDVMTKTHATGSAKTYGKRYLVKDIFNLAIGEDDDDGNAAGAHVEVIGNKVLGGLLADLKTAKSDEAVCQIWDTGSKALEQTGAKDLVAELAKAVADRRAAFTYPADRFEKNLPDWVQVVATGKKSEADLIAFITTKHPLSVDQKDAISQAIQAASK